MKKIMVLKIGSGILVTGNGQFNEPFISQIAKQVGRLQKKGIGVVLVVSGATAFGSKFINIPKMQHRVSRQAAAGIGQVYLTHIFNTLFSQHHIQIAQLLLTRSVFNRVVQKNNLKLMVAYYLSKGIVPFINENDVIDLNSFGGNDLLAAEIAILIGADKFLILSTMKGSLYGVGGGQTKLEAIGLVSGKKIQAEILDGQKENILQTIV